MPTFMDVHHIEGGVSAQAVAELHRKDLEREHGHGVHFIKYWLDEEAGKVFCLSDSPSAEATMAVHTEAHGAPADEIYEVSEYT
jgi:Nickel responsive protein SCO4226-like